MVMLFKVLPGFHARQRYFGCRMSEKTFAQVMDCCPIHGGHSNWTEPTQQISTGIVVEMSQSELTLLVECLHRWKD